MSLLDRTDWATPAAALCVIAPEEARAILRERDSDPEEPDAFTIARIAEELEQDRWILNGATIAFHRDGTLRDGRHRLWACVASGMPLKTWVIFGTESPR